MRCSCLVISGARPGIAAGPGIRGASHPLGAQLPRLAAMRLSTRNQLDGTVISVTRGEAMAVVRIRLTGGDEITSSITRDAVDDLDLAEGARVKVLIKSTEVTLGIE